jgi:hypothetical protein
MSSSANPIIDALERIEALAALGWTLPMGMTPREFHGLVMEGELTCDRVERWFADYYDRDDCFEFRRLTDRVLYSDHLSLWNPLLKQVFEAFERSHFSVCVPSLLLVLEGAIAVPWDVTRFHELRIREGFFRRKIREARTESVVQYQWKSVAALIGTVFAGADPNREFAVPKRNLILHGKSDPAKWDRGDCLRLFQAIDTIASLGNELPTRIA